MSIEGTQIALSNDNGETVTLSGSGGDLTVGAWGTHGTVRLRSDGGEVRATLAVDTTNNNGFLALRNQNGVTARLDGNTGDLTVGAWGTNGTVILRSAGGAETMTLQGATGNIRTRGDIFLENADCAEEFDVDEQFDIEPGTVMVVNESGILTQSTTPYDKKVAGVVSGSGKYKPAIVLDKRSSKNKRVAIALMGKVFCKVDVTDSPIEVGDLLTTSSTEGHAMKVSDYSKAMGSVIGKALGSMKSGTGFIPALVALQ
jgi:hypothetical protein